MKSYSILLPSLALGFAAVLLWPASDAAGFSLLGQRLNFGQRDVRLFNNFTDATSNDNLTPHTMFPGAIGLELSIWKGMLEWGSGPHGDGSGDSTQSDIGSGNANFDALWSGQAGAVGSADENIVSAISGCTAGVLAFAEGPSDNGWRIRFCDDANSFDDGPDGIPGGRFDLQSIMAHEYGHVLGLGHSLIAGATMQAGIGSGSESGRSINADDRAGIVAIYGAVSLDKLLVCKTDVNAGVLTITGHGFDSFNNTVWFTNENITDASEDPRVQVSGLFSGKSGTEIVFTVPAAARAGDVLVRTPGMAYNSISNAFPCDLLGALGKDCPLLISQIVPNSLPPLQPGSTQSVTLTGRSFLRVNTITLEPGITLSSTRWTLVNDSTITLDLPEAMSLGVQTLTLSDGNNSTGINFTVAATSTATLQVGTGDALNLVSSGETFSIVVGGSVGSTHRVYYSTSPLPSIHSLIQLDLGNGFSQVFAGPSVVIGAAGTTTISMPLVYTGSPKVFYAQSVDLSTGPMPQFEVSNLQSVLLQP